MYQILKERLRDALARHIQLTYHVDLGVVLERPPKIEMGEAASPVCFELAKRLKKAPRMIAQEIANDFRKVEGVARLEVAGAGYLNAYFDRGAFWEKMVIGNEEVASGEWRVARAFRMKVTARKRPQGSKASAMRYRAIAGGKIIVEHTSINPNKAAHIGHVRNAVLGDTLVRILRHAGHRVQIQNYIDNTGVQVADVVIGLLWMEKRTPVSVKMMAMEPRFDYDCWDIYAKATQFFAADKVNAAKLRGDTLRAIEEGRGEESEVAEVVADAIVTFHLRTMARLGIYYDLLARESEILHLKFWDAAFEMLKKSGAIVLDPGRMRYRDVTVLTSSSSTSGSMPATPAWVATSSTTRACKQPRFVVRPISKTNLEQPHWPTEAHRPGPGPGRLLHRQRIRAADQLRAVDPIREKILGHGVFADEEYALKIYHENTVLDGYPVPTRPTTRGHPVWPGRVAAEVRAGELIQALAVHLGADLGPAERPVHGIVGTDLNREHVRNRRTSTSSPRGRWPAGTNTLVRRIRFRPGWFRQSWGASSA